MFTHALTVLVGYLALASSRETIRTLPTISNSLVNLGKMDISFHFTGNGRDPPSHRIPDHEQSFSPFFTKIDSMIDEPCLCSSLRNAKDSPLTNPSGLFNKILTNNDLFSFNNDPVHSSLCCDSHDQEASVVIEFLPNHKPTKSDPTRSNLLPMMPFILDTVIPNKSMLPPLKNKAKELFMFPKKKDMSNVMSTFDMAKFPSVKKDTVLKEDITVVGDKKLENNINLFKPPSPVKKDLSAQEKTTKENENEKPAEEGDKIIVEAPKMPNAV